jgi:hypothetical protein
LAAHDREVAVSEASRQRIREAGRAGLAAAGAARSAEASAPKPDERPRFVGGPLAGKLKDPYEREREALGLDSEDVAEWFESAVQIPEWKVKYDKFEERYRERIDAENTEKDQARRRNDYEVARRYLGLPDRFTDPQEWTKSENADVLKLAQVTRAEREAAEAALGRLRELPEIK